MNNQPKNKRMASLGKITSLAIAIALALPFSSRIDTGMVSGLIPSAYADEDGGSSAKGGKKATGGHEDDHGSSSEKGQKDNLTKGPANSRGDYDGSGQGPRQKSDEISTRGTRPVWAKEGVTTELGRLNVVRAPQSVLDRQLAEALASITENPELMAVYSLSIADFQASLTDDTVRIDAPLANLALYEAFVTELAKDPSATSVTISSVNKETGLPVTTTFDLSGSATPTSILGIFLGTATDKDVTKIGGVSTDVVSSINLILGISDAFSSAGLTSSAVAEAAEDVRETISTVHEQ